MIGGGGAVAVACVDVLRRAAWTEKR